MWPIDKKLSLAESFAIYKTLLNQQSGRLIGIINNWGNSFVDRQTWFFFYTKVFAKQAIIETFIKLDFL